MSDVGYACRDLTNLGCSSVGKFLNHYNSYLVIMFPIYVSKFLWVIEQIGLDCIDLCFFFFEGTVQSSFSSSEV